MLRKESAKESGEGSLQNLLATSEPLGQPLGQGRSSPRRLLTAPAAAVNGANVPVAPSGHVPKPHNDFYTLLQKLALAHEVAIANAAARGTHDSVLPVSSVRQTLQHQGQTLQGQTLQGQTLQGQTLQGQTLQGLPAKNLPSQPVSVQRIISLLSSETSSRASVPSARVVPPAAKRFSLLRVWNEDPVLEAQKSSDRRVTRQLAPHSRLRTNFDEVSDETSVVGSSCSRNFLVHPSSPRRHLWDLICMMLLAYDIITIPFIGAFDPPGVPFTTTMNYVTMVFWCLDMIASAVTGYQEGRFVIMDVGMILRRYAQTWLILDTIIVGVDCGTLYFLGMTDGGSAARLGRTLRTLRFVRTLRLIRLLKMKRILQEIQDQINTEALSICFGVVKIILVLVLANHVVACLWYGIGTMGVGSVGEGLSTWIVQNDLEGKTLAYKYFTSLHWSLTQFTPASMEVTPNNVAERVFSVIVLLIAMITFSSFVSILTASMAELRKISSDETRQFWLLRRYLRDWRVSRRFAVRLQRYLEYAYQKQRQRVQAKDVKLLGLLSGHLHDELKAETLSVHLIAHPLFFNAHRSLRIFSKALSDMFLGRGDCAFTYGEEGSSMLFLCTGHFNYHLGEGDVCINPDWQPQHVKEGQWVAEAVLWTSWLHLGDLQAVTEGQAISIDARKFGEAVQIFKPAWLAFRGYAERFLQAMNRIDREELTDLLHTVLSSREILDGENLMKHHSTRARDEYQDTSICGLGRALRSRAGKLKLCAWLTGKTKPADDGQCSVSSQEQHSDAMLPRNSTLELDPALERDYEACPGVGSAGVQPFAQHSNIGSRSPTIDELLPTCSFSLDGVASTGATRESTGATRESTGATRESTGATRESTSRESDGTTTADKARSRSRMTIDEL